jgi:hypothetical protein
LCSDDNVWFVYEVKGTLWRTNVLPRRIKKDSTLSLILNSILSALSAESFIHDICVKRYILLDNDIAFYFDQKERRSMWRNSTAWTAKLSMPTLKPCLKEGY